MSNRAPADILQGTLDLMVLQTLATRGPLHGYALAARLEHPAVPQLPNDLKVVNITTNMEEAISAADANRRFSELLRRIRKGKSIVITSHGKAVARIIPMTDRDNATRGARAALLERLRAQPVVDIGKWSREELYQERG